MSTSWGPVSEDDARLVYAEWAQLRGGLPEHGAEIMTAHQGKPSRQVQDETHGTGLPDVDLGATEAQKYGGGQVGY